MSSRTRLVAALGLVLQLGCRVSHEGKTSDAVTVRVSAATVDPLIGPERAVGTPVIGRAAGNQGPGSVAYNGSSYLAVWADARPPGLFATRISAAGQVQDLTGIPIAAPASQVVTSGSPNVVWDGTSFLIVYVGADQKQVLGRRLRPDGTFVDAAPFVIANEASLSTNLGQCAAYNNGAKTFVVWTSDTFVTGSGHVGWDIYGVRVSGATVLDAAPIAITTASRDQQGPRVSFGGGNWLVTWMDTRNWAGTTKSDDYGARVQDSTGTVLDPAGILLVSDTDLRSSPWPASDGTNFLVAHVGPTATRVDSATGATSAVAISEPPSRVQKSVAFANGSYQVVWSGLLAAMGNRVPSAGAALDGVGVALESCFKAGPSIFAAGSAFYLTWLQTGVGGTDILGSRYSLAGGLADRPGTSLANGGNAQAIVDIEGGGANGWFAVWRDDRAPASTMYGARIDPSGRSLDPAGIPIVTPIERYFGSSSIGTTIVPAVAFNGTHYLIAWAQTNAILARRVDVATGQISDATTLATFSGGLYAQQVDLASDGTGWFAVWPLAGGPTWRVMGARISAAGVNLDPAGIPVSTQTANQTEARVVFGAGAYLVVWATSVTAPPPGPTTTTLYGARVNPETGLAQDPSPNMYLATTNLAPPPSPVMAAFGGSSFVLLASYTRVRISAATGAMLDSGAAPTGTSVARTLAFDGSSFLTLYTFSALDPQINRNVQGIKGTRFLDDGSDLDATDFQFVAAPDFSASASTPVAAGIPGKFLVGFNAFDPNPSVLAMRVRTHVVQTCGGDGACLEPTDASVASDDAQAIIPSSDASPTFCSPDASIMDGPADGGDAPSSGDGGDAPSSGDGGDAPSSGDGGDAPSSPDGPSPLDATVTSDARPDGGSVDAKAADAGVGSGSSGCGCRTGEAPIGGSWIAVAIGLALVSARTRRQRLQGRP